MISPGPNRPLLLRLVAPALAVALVSCLAEPEPSQTRQALSHHVRPAVASGLATRVGAPSPTQLLSVAITLPLRNEGELHGLLDGLYDPSSPEYHRFLTVPEFTERFGPTADDYRAVAAYAEARGFAVTSTAENRLVVEARGTVAEVEAAFHVTMGTYRHPTEDRTFYSPDREPSLDISVPVAHISGLNDFSIPHHPSKVTARALPIESAAGGSGPGSTYIGSDFRAAYYGGTALTGKGQSVGILAEVGYNRSDVDLTFSSIGVTNTVPINDVSLDSTALESSGSDIEVVLDIVQAIGMAPGLSQVRVYVDNEQFSSDIPILNKMATENIAKQLSSSWLWVPDSTEAEPIFRELAAQGQSFFNASGDWGAYNPNNPNDPGYPAEDPYVTAVGGTSLVTTSPGGSWASETAWSPSGGGPSDRQLPIPSYQVGIANAANGASTTVRNVPDVSMNSDSNNYLCWEGTCGVVYGTSAAAPRWAGYLALVNEWAVANGKPTAGFINPAIYALGKGSSYASVLHDITIGSNPSINGGTLSYNAVAGYDLVTGWGSPNGQALINALAGTSAQGFTLSESSPSLTLVPGGASVASTVTVHPVNGFTGSVTLSASGLPTGVTASLGTNPTTGASTLTLSASSSVTASAATVTLTGTSGTRTATTTVALAIGFTLAAAQSSENVIAGSSVSDVVSVVLGTGFSGPVTLSVTGLPTGAKGTFSPASISASGTSTLTLTTTSSTPAGTYPLTITGKSGSHTETTSVSLSVFTPATTFGIVASPTALTAQLIATGDDSMSTTLTITTQSGFTNQTPVIPTITGMPTGVLAEFIPNDPVPMIANETFAFTLNLIATPEAPLGTFPITASVLVGTQAATATISFTVTAPPATFTVGSADRSVTVAPGSSTTDTITVTSQNGFDAATTLSATGLPKGITATFSPVSVTPVADGSASSTLTFDALSTVTAGTYSIAIVGTSGGTTATLPLDVTVSPSSTATEVSLKSAFDRTGIVTDGTTFSSKGGLDDSGHAYSGTLLGAAVTWNGTPFELGAKNVSNVVSTSGQVVTLPSGTFSTLRMLAAGVGSGQTAQRFTITYTDGTKTTVTRSLSSWETPASYAGESRAVTMKHLDTSSGGEQTRSVYVYGYSLSLNKAKTVKSVRLPSNANVEVLALTLVQ